MESDPNAIGTEFLVTHGRQADTVHRLAEIYGSSAQGHGAPDLEDAASGIESSLCPICA